MNSRMIYEIRCFHIQSRCPGAVDMFPHVSTTVRSLTKALCFHMSCHISTGNTCLIPCSNLALHFILKFLMFFTRTVSLGNLSYAFKACIKKLVWYSLLLATGIFSLVLCLVLYLCCVDHYYSCLY